MNDLLVARTTKTVRLLGSRPKMIAAHLACRRTGAGRDGSCESKRDREGLVAWLGDAPAPAHKFTRANDFSGLSALLRNFRAPLSG